MIKPLRQALVKNKKDAEKKITSKLNMFDKIPDKCAVCSIYFDKKSKEMATTWIVVVRGEAGSVRLFCPTCIERTKEVIESEN